MGSEETRGGCAKINEIRTQKGWRALEVEIVGLLWTPLALWERLGNAGSESDLPKLSSTHLRQLQQNQ